MARGKGLIMQNESPEQVRQSDLLSGFRRLTEDDASELDAALLVACVIDEHLDAAERRDVGRHLVERLLEFDGAEVAMPRKKLVAGLRAAFATAIFKTHILRAAPHRRKPR